jgi:hypothetical protein
MTSALDVVHRADGSEHFHTGWIRDTPGREFVPIAESRVIREETKGTSSADWLVLAMEGRSGLQVRSYEELRAAGADRSQVPSGE